MRWFGLVLLCAVIVNVCGDPDPDPKKYNKVELKPVIKNNNSTLTDEERQFLREVEAKFGIKSEVPFEEEKAEIDTEEEKDTEDDKNVKPTISAKLPFPAVIAIEIVNDTDTKTKGKRTIDANLGYGFRTNGGYTYRYLGKPTQEQGKFMIYPYSQEDIPPASSSSSSNYNQQYPQQVGHTTKISPNVEITPSQAYELLPTKEEEEQTSYDYKKPAVQLNTKYEDIQGIQSPPPPYPSHNSQQTLYTTYNGEQFSSLSSQFPKIMSNFLVDSSQLLNSPTYQGAGITQDHLRPHGAQLDQRVVPVLVLRVPSSYIKDPSAELYANLPQNYPLSQYLNSVNLQELVNQYFKKIGYPFAPKVMAYPTSSLSHSVSHTETSAPPVPAYQPQHYASPYVQPSYTHADYSGVQYSAVQPVMAKYPTTPYTKTYYVMRPQSMYQQPLQQSRYMYRYKYVPQSLTQSQSYYSQSQQPQYHQEVERRPQYQHVEEEQTQYQQEEEQQPQYQQEPEKQTQYHQEAEQPTQYQQQEEEQVSHSNDEKPQSHDTQKSLVEYQPSSSNDEQDSEGYKYPSPQNQQENEHEPLQHITPSYESVPTSTPSYDHSPEVSTPDYGPTKVPLSFHGSSPSVQINYQPPTQKETVAIFPRSQTGHKAGAALNYIYQKINNEHSGSESLVLHENYPSKDHTIATVLPLSYKRPQQSEPVQSVSYVTPVTTMKYHSHYRVMVPQTILRKPTDEKVSYVNSHSVPSGYSSPLSSSLGSSSQFQTDPVDPEEYSMGSQYASALRKLRSSLYHSSSSYPRSSYTHLKRMTKPENKSDSPATTKKTERSENKKSS